ncbi:TPA: multidrug MFS transporter, partial [Streptococcus suis]|nr:multidrug MFS transporter [Streptococcus suis]
MIFVTVGTHEQQFNRLIKEIDLLKKNGSITDE